MTYDRERHHRRSIRLKGYDYAQPGAYFITICTQDRACLFGEVADGEMRLNEMGQVVCECWSAIPEHFSNGVLDAFVAMPNHVHGMVVIVDGRGTACRAPAGRAPTEQFGRPITGSVPTIIRSFKSAVTRRINALRGTPGAPVWQRNYYEHIIRNDDALHRIRQYIADNPTRWAFDREGPTAIHPGPEDAWAT